MILIVAVITQAIPFLLLHWVFRVSYRLLNATDMTLDGSFVLGAALFARLVTLGVSPTLALVAAMLGGMLAGKDGCHHPTWRARRPVIIGVLANLYFK